MRECPGRACGWGYTGADSQTSFCKRRLDIRQQPRLSTEQVCCSGDVDEDAIRRIERTPRAPALRPHGKLFKRGKIARQIGRCSLDRRAQSARISEHHAFACTSIVASLVHRMDARPVCSFSDKNCGVSISALPRLPTAALRRERQPPAIDRQSGAPNGEDTA